MGILRKFIGHLSNDERYSLSMIRVFFWDINWIKTLWFNFKALPFVQAIKIPFLLSYNTKVKSVGKIVLSNDVHLGMVSIGVIKIGDFETNSEKTIFNNMGTLSIAGNMKIHPGVKLVIRKGAKLTVGERVGFGGNSKVICHKSITIGDDFRMSWNSQIFDTDFHFLYNIEKCKHYPRLKPVTIGNNVFVGNGATIGKGTTLPDGCVVSCISKVSGDFSAEGNNLLISGNPAKVLIKGVEMSSGWYMEKEDAIAKQFNE